MNHTGSIQAPPQSPSRATVTSACTSSISDAQVLAPPDAFIDESLAIGPAAGTFSEENSAADNNHSNQNNHNTATTATTAMMMKKRKVCHDYHDHANDTDAKATKASVAPTVSSEDDDENHLCVQQTADDSNSSNNNNNNNNGPPTKKRRGPRGGVAQPFPEKLFEMLASVEKEGFSPIVSWQPHGRCFVVHNPKEFVSKVMPFYFRQTKLTSFQRQLNLYGFCRLTSGKDRGGYYHELFLRGRPFLCKRMMRTRIKGTGIKAASSPNTEPDFYSMPPVRDITTVPPSPTQEPLNAPLHPQHHPQTALIVHSSPAAHFQQPQALSVPRIPSPTTIAALPSQPVTMLHQNHAAQHNDMDTTSTAATQQHSTPPMAPMLASLEVTPTVNSIPTADAASSPQIEASIAEAPATVSPLQAPMAPAPAPQQLSLNNSNDDGDDPLPNSVISFEGQQFHYLDPSSFDQCIRISANQVLAATDAAIAASALTAVKSQSPPPPPPPTTLSMQAPAPTLYAVMAAPMSHPSAANGNTLQGTVYVNQASLPTFMMAAPAPGMAHAQAHQYFPVSHVMAAPAPSTTAGAPPATAAAPSPIGGTPMPMVHV